MEPKKSYTDRLKQKVHEFYGSVKDNQARPFSLVIKSREKNQLALNYQYLSKDMSYNASEGIVLSFLDPNGTITIKIEGRNLDELWDALIWHRVTFVRELAGAADTIPENELCVTDIKINEG